MLTDLLDSGDVASDVVDGDGVLNVQAVALALHSGLVNQHTRIRSKPWASIRRLLCMRCDQIALLQCNPTIDEMRYFAYMDH